MRVVLTREASADLANALGHIDGHERMVGNRFVASHYLHHSDIYTIQIDFVEVIGVFHTSRDPASKPRP